MIIIESQAVGPFHKNGFVVACPRTRDAVLIDPGDEVDGLLEFIERVFQSGGGSPLSLLIPQADHFHQGGFRADYVYFPGQNIFCVCLSNGSHDLAPLRCEVVRLLQQYLLR